MKSPPGPPAYLFAYLWYESQATSPFSPRATLGGSRWEKVSQIVGPRPPSFTAPSTCGFAAKVGDDAPVPFVKPFARHDRRNNPSSKGLAGSSRGKIKLPLRRVCVCAVWHACVCAVGTRVYLFLYQRLHIFSSGSTSRRRK